MAKQFIVEYYEDKSHSKKDKNKPSKNLNESDFYSNIKSSIDLLIPGKPQSERDAVFQSILDAITARGYAQLLKKKFKVIQ